MPQHPRILVLDDEPGPRLALGWALRKHGSLMTVPCATVDEAREALVKDPTISVAIVDLSMPDMSGADAVRELRRIKPGLGAILHTGMSTETCGELAPEDRAVFDAILPKPAPSNEFVGKVVADLLARGTESGSPGGGQL